jgi:hypothetical protein
MTRVVAPTDRACLTPPTLLCADDFDDDRDPGCVVGSVARSGATRLGVDREHLVAIDHGALRLQPLAEPGWARQAVLYGPFTRTPGLALSVLALNGHNASQTYYFAEGAKATLRRWAVDLRHRRSPRRPHHHDNFAVGWFDSAIAGDPLLGNAFVMHATDHEGGELRAGVGGLALPAVRGVQNVPILYVVVLRARGAAYYAASVPGTFGLGALPTLRPLAIDTTAGTANVYAGVEQRILGEVGYRVDTRVERVRVQQRPEWSQWYGTASVADHLTGAGALDGSPTEVGGIWFEHLLPEADGGRCTAPVPALLRTADGTRCTQPRSTAVALAPAPAGLVHLQVAAGDGTGRAGVVFRVGDRRGWCFVVGRDGCELARRDGRAWRMVLRSTRERLRPHHEHTIQVTDDGTRIGIHVDGRLAFGRWIDDDRGADERGVGIHAAGGFDGCFRSFEAHPRAIEVPEALDPEPVWNELGVTCVVDDDFAGEGPLDHDVGSGPRWSRTLGTGSVVRTGHGGARVAGSCAHPNPGRTAHTIEWRDPAFADVALRVRNPERCGHPAHGARTGVVFWQDDDNYVVVNLYRDETFPGGSISSFYRIDGREVMHDAVWTVTEVPWGGDCELRVAFDGARFTAHLDGRPSLHRALTDVYPDAVRLRIQRVGVVANEEWGDDTGTTLHRFTARGRAAAAGQPG